MRHACRLFLSVILFTAVAGFALAQDSAAPPPAPVPEVVQPVPELPVIPVPEAETPAVEPALVAEPIPVTVEPVVPVAVEPPAVVKPVTMTVKSVTKKTSRKPVEKPVVHLAEPVQAAAPLASTAAAETPANPLSAEAAASTAPLKSIAPPPPPVQAPAVESAEETKTVTTMGIGGWLIAGVAVAALVGVITLFRRRRTVKDTSIVDLKAVTPELSAAYVTRR